MAIKTIMTSFQKTYPQKNVKKWITLITPCETVEK